MQQFVSNPKVTLNIVTRDQKVGLEDQRALLVGQIAGAVRATGTITFAANPSADATITLNGTAWTFKASGATGNQVNIGATLAATLAALVVALNASSETQTVKCTYWANATVLTIRHKTGGTSGNSFTLAASVATPSGATLSGGAAAPGTASSGDLVIDMGRTDAEINELFGAGSHLAQVARAFRAVNPVTNVDCLPLADHASGVRAVASLTFSGTATRAGTLYVSVVSEEQHTYQVDVNSGDGADDVLATLVALIDDDRYLEFNYHDDGASVLSFEANNAGLHANDWLLAVDGSVPGLTVSISGWATGATDPSLTSVFDPVSNIRYQTIVWPHSYSQTTLKAFIDPRKNVDNDVKDGRAFLWSNKSMGNVKTDCSTLNSSEIVVMTNKPTSAADWVGPHLPEAPDVLAAKFAAARARRFESNISISDIVTTNEPNDQFGGPDLASLPYFNTPMLGVGMPKKGTGYTYEEQLELENAGVSVFGVNRSSNAVVAGVVVTTWLNDAAGNPDDTWKYLEWRDTHGQIREYCVLNLRKRFAQYRLTSGELIPNRAMANEAMIRGYILGLCIDLMDMSLIQKGQEARQYIQDNMSVVLTLDERKAQVALKVPMVSQLGVILGTVAFNFSTN